MERKLRWRPVDLAFPTVALHTDPKLQIEIIKKGMEKITDEKMPEAYRAKLKELEEELK